MIRLYNPTMEQALSSYNNTLEQYAEARAQLKRGQYSVSTDKEEAEDNGDTEDYAYYASEEAIYKSAAASYQDMYESMQETSSTSSLRQTERQMTVAAQALMISYDTMQLEKETVQLFCQRTQRKGHGKDADFAAQSKIPCPVRACADCGYCRIVYVVKRSWAVLKGGFK